MIKNSIRCCSCFLDRAIWFLNSPDYSVQLWRFACFKIEEERFIKENKPTVEQQNGVVVLNNKMTVCCVKCFNFQLFHLSSQENMMTIFDNLECRFVTIDSFTYGDGFDDDIFIGNSQFDVENFLLTPAQRDELFKRMSKNLDSFLRRPEKKSCFTSLQKKSYTYFCATCKNIYDEFFKRELYLVSSDSSLNDES